MTVPRASRRIAPLARIPLTIKHFYNFGADRDRVGASLVNPQSWDAIRESRGPFGLPSTRSEWEKAAAEGDFSKRAAALAAVADEVGARRICSYGVGAGLIELNLALQRPDLEIICTDFAPRSLARIKELFPEAEIHRHDLRTDPSIAADLHLFHRIDSELSNEQWREVIPRFHEPVLLVATELLGPMVLLHELRVRISRSSSNAGYVRTEAGLRSVWAPTHRDRKLAVGSHTAFLLVPR